MATTSTSTTKASVEERLAAALAELAGLRDAAKRNSRRYYLAHREECLAKRRAYMHRRRDYLRERVVCPHCGRTAQRRSLRSHQKSKRCQRERVGLRRTLGSTIQPNESTDD